MRHSSARETGEAAVVFARVMDPLTLIEQLHVERQREYGEIAVRGSDEAGIVVDHCETL